MKFHTLAVALALLAPVSAGSAGGLAQDDEWTPDRKELRRLGGKGTEQPLRAGLDWLVQHQVPDGHWGAESFVERCAEHRGKACDMPGQGPHDVGVTALGLLALSGIGGNRTTGPYHAQIESATTWLVAQQGEGGCIGPKAHQDFFYSHLAATIALAHVFGPGADTDEMDLLQRAVDFILSGQAPGAGWRYDVPSIGDNDSLITVWAISALYAAGEAGCDVPTRALLDGLTWIESCTVEGRTGYDAPHTVSARTPSNAGYPRELTEAITAAALWARCLLGVASTENPNDAMAARLLARLPQYDRDVLANDMYYWHWGTYAMFQAGGKEWKAWNEAFKSAALEMQSKRGGAEGSWDPIGPWGYAGGRVYATAIQCLSLEVYYRYPRFDDAEPSEWRRHMVAAVGSIPILDVIAPEFIGSTEVRVSSRVAGAEIRYTLDGTDPTAESPLAKKKIKVRETGTLRAAGFVDGERVEPIVMRNLTRVEPIAAVAAPRSRKKRKSVRVEIFDLAEPGLPDFDSLPLGKTFAYEFLASPREARKPKCGVRLSGFISFPESGVYVFEAGDANAIQLRVAGEIVLERDDDGARDRIQGHAPLAKGWHPFELAWSNIPYSFAPRLTAGLAGETLAVIEPDRLAHE